MIVAFIDTFLELPYKGFQSLKGFGDDCRNP